jgi:hypothetical protein
VPHVGGEQGQFCFDIGAGAVPSQQSIHGETVPEMPDAAFSSECRVPENAESHSGIFWKRLEWTHLAISTGLCDSALFLVFPECSIGCLETR